MKLPNGDQAIITDDKLLEFLLNEEHSEQPGHAVLFKSLLGIGLQNADQLRAALKDAARTSDVSPGKPSPHGKKYEIRFQMTGPRGTYTILSVWIIEQGSSIPRLVTAFIE